MKLFPTLAFAALALAACANQGPSQNEAMDRINQEFAGQDAKFFFAAFGAPAETHDLRTGEKVYRWISIDPHRDRLRNDYLSYPGGRVQMFDSTTGGDYTSRYCEISIHADTHDKIERFNIVSDSVGNYSSSNCAEIFGGPDEKHTSSSRETYHAPHS